MPPQNVNAPLMHGLPTRRIGGIRLRSALLQELQRDSINGKGGQQDRVEVRNAKKKAPHYTTADEKEGKGPDYDD